MSLIEQLKHNKTAYGLLEPEERECFEKVKKENTIYYMYDDSWKQSRGNSFCRADTYRIKPDYQPEPQTERCEVFTEHLYHSLRYIRKGRTWVCLHEALSDPDFMYFEFEDGFKSLSPRLTAERGRLIVLDNTGKPAPIPKWVLFVKRSK